jgi:hypothetical protein
MIAVLMAIANIIAIPVPTTYISVEGKDIT